MRLSWLLPDVQGIPVLMYHRVWPGVSDGLTLTPDDLREQWNFLKSSGYECLSLNRFLRIARGEEKAPGKAFLLTFDDGYHNNLLHVVPLLRELSWEATIFIIAGTLDNTYPLDQDDPINRKMDLEELRSIAGRHVRLGLHGYKHENFSQQPVVASESAIRKSIAAFEQSGIPFAKVLAYPYGARPQDKNEFFSMKAWMSDFGIEAAFRIGNKPQRMPAADFYEMKRIDIRGEDTLHDFKIKLTKGKLKPF